MPAARSPGGPYLFSEGRPEVAGSESSSRREREEAELAGEEAGLGGSERDPPPSFWGLRPWVTRLWRKGLWQVPGSPGVTARTQGSHGPEPALGTFQHSSHCFS